MNCLNELIVEFSLYLHIKNIRIHCPVGFFGVFKSFFIGIRNVIQTLRPQFDFFNHYLKWTGSVGFRKCDIFIDFKTNNIYINNNLLISPNWKYVFSSWEIKLISLYIENWKLLKNVYLVFWTQLKDSYDSRKFWWVSKSNIIWKVIK